MSKIISIVAYRRYEYFRRVLEALSRCDGIEEYSCLIHVDPGYVPVEDLARHFPLPRKEVVINPFNFGCSGNVHAALSHGFEKSDYVICLEDDIVPARDALRYFEYVNRTFKNDPDCFGGCAYHRTLPPESEFHKVLKVRWFTPWGWSTWRDRFEEMEASWPFDRTHGTMVWDTAANKISRKDRYVVHPWLARTQNIGAKNGTYCPKDPTFHAENQFNPHWAGAVKVYPGEFHE